MNEAVAAAPEKGLKRRRRTLMALALATPALRGAAIVADLLTRKRSVTVKTQGRIVAVVAVFNLYRDTRKVKAAKN